ncbi:hypothetical protein MJG53_012531 [Ovis ammon polii x Ovis aries]|uniref:Uncharacterized protein n=1 Tax=Ovis ammon polii x Ovis aries TaxID=2918886 RepID=A0ACB9UL47_9CETA|nr:hypothetical protein MJG53_012531 [Ovis ammon polii x Ovis aries]
MPAFETRTDSPGETPEVPQIHVSTGEESSGSGPDFTQGLRLRHRRGLRPRKRRERNPETTPRNSHGDWPFLRPPERVPDVPVRRGLTPLGRLQKYPKIHVSTGEESSGSDPDSTQGLRPQHRREKNPERPPRNSHGDWPFLMPPEWVPEVPVRRGLTPLGRLQKYPKIHVSTGEESSGSDPDSTQGLRPQHRREKNPERPPRNSHGDWPFLRPPERVPEVPVRRGLTPLGRLQKYPKIHVSTGEESSGSDPDSTQGLRPQHRREKNPERPPRNSHGDWPFLMPPEWVPEVPVRRGLTPLGRLQKYPKIHVSTGEESSGSDPDSTQGLRPQHRREKNPERPPRNSHGDWPFLRPPERVPEVPVRRGLTPLGRLQKYPKIHVSTGEESSGSDPDSTQGLRPQHRREKNPERPPRNSHGDWPFLMPPERVPEVPVRRGLTPLGRLQKYPKIHVSTGEESSGSDPDSTQGLRPQHRREKNPERPPRNSHGDWPFLRPPERVPEVPVPRIDSRHVCTWDSPVVKPRGKDSRKTTDPLIHAADGVTLLLPLWRKAQVHARIRDEY